MERIGQRGEGRASFLVSAVLLVIGGLAAWEYIPVRVARAELTDFVEEQCKFATRLSAKQIQKNIYDKAVELDIPLPRKEIQVTKGGGKIRVRWNYTVPLEFPGYTHQYRVSDEMERPIFIF